MPMIFRPRSGGWMLSGVLALLAILVLCAGGNLRAQPAPPPAPAGYFTDEAGVVDAAAGIAINEQLKQFERDTSNQILVAIYPSLPPDAEIAQYATMTYKAWGVGQKGPSLGQKGGNNGAILFVFVNDRKVFIATGRGLEGALPDATCKDIIVNILQPAFRQGDYTAGVQQAVNAMLAATKGEYKGDGQTVYTRKHQNQSVPVWVVILIIVVIILIQIFGRSGWSSGPVIFTSGGFGGGGGGGGSNDGGDSGGFSGGGGDSAGGGAGGSW